MKLAKGCSFDSYNIFILYLIGFRLTPLRDRYNVIQTLQNINPVNMFLIHRQFIPGCRGKQHFDFLPTLHIAFTYRRSHGGSGYIPFYVYVYLNLQYVAKQTKNVNNIKC